MLTLWVALGHMELWKSIHFLGPWKATPELSNQQAEFTLISSPPPQKKNQEQVSTATK